MAVRELSPELAKIARDELGEVPTRISTDLMAIKDWLAKQPHINARTDDQWILNFLRGCKFSLERTKEKLDNYYTVRTTVTEIFPIPDPRVTAMQELLSLGTSLVLPKPCSPDGARVLMFRLGQTDPSKFTILQSSTLYFMIAELLQRDDDATIVAGQRVIVDMKGVSMSHFAQMTPLLMKKLISSGQDAVPVRHKSIHYMNTFPGFESILALVKKFMSEKNRKRLFVHNDNFDELYKVVPQSVLPEEYGGKGGTIKEIIDHWKQKLEDNRDWLLENAKYKTDESKRPGSPKTAEGMFGIEGSFRQLNVD